jgi:mRNA interferase MazF
MIIQRGDIYYADLRPVVGSEQGRTIDKKRLKDKVCHLDNQILGKIDKALEISLELYT